MKIDAYGAPLMVSWQLTRACNLACLHCCASSSPAASGSGELSKPRALALAAQIVAAGVPYVILCGGEPAVSPYFMALARRLGEGGVWLKIETNGQTQLDTEALKRLPIRSVQVSIDGAAQETYARLRPGGSLASALSVCRAARAASLPLEITFAPVRFNIGDAERVINMALELGAFRFNTGRLMKLGRARKNWARLERSCKDYAEYLKLLTAKEAELKGRMEICFRPFSLSEDLALRGAQAPGVLLILPDGKVKVAASLPHICADLKKVTLLDAWDAYRSAWNSPAFRKRLQH